MAVQLDAPPGRLQKVASRWSAGSWAVTSSEMGSSSARRTRAPCARPGQMMTIFLARDRPHGPSSTPAGNVSSPKKSLAASWRVTGSSVLMRVRLLSGGFPGSLNRCVPSAMPQICRSIPPPSRWRARRLRKRPPPPNANRPSEYGCSRRDVTWVEKRSLHESAIGYGSNPSPSGPVLVEIDTSDVGEIEPFLAVQADQSR